MSESQLHLHPQSDRNLKELFRQTIWVSLGTFFLMIGYEGIRSPSNTLFQQLFGVSKFPWVLAAVPIFLLPVHAAYAWTLTRFGNRITLLGSIIVSSITLFFLHHYSLENSKIAVVGLMLFREIYIVLVLEQLWSYMNSTTTLENSKFVHSLFSGLGNLGGAIGGLLVGHYALTVGTHSLLWMPQIGLILCALFLFKTLKVVNPNPQVLPQSKIKKPSEDSKSLQLGWSAFRQFPVLVSILALVLLSQLCMTTSNLALQSSYKELGIGADAQTAFSGKMYSWISFGSLGLQFFVAPFLLRWLSPIRIQILIPLIALLLHGSAFASPGLIMAAVAFASMKAMDYSLFRISKEILFIPLSFEARFQAKQFIDTIGYRAAKAAASLLLVGLTSLGWEQSRFFLGLSSAAILGWLLISIHISKLHREN